MNFFPPISTEFSLPFEFGPISTHYRTRSFSMSIRMNDQFSLANVQLHSESQSVLKLIA